MLSFYLSVVALRSISLLLLVKEGRREEGRKERGREGGGAGCAHSIQLKTGLLTEMCFQRALIEIHSCQETLPSIFKANALCTWCYQGKGRHEGCIISEE